jgi:hypothetical protein
VRGTWLLGHAGRPAFYPDPPEGSLACPEDAG